MPYIAINTAKEVSAAQAEKIKSALGKLIELIPNKSEANLMVDFSDKRTMYFAGNKISGGFIDIRFFTKAELEAKKKFTAELFKLLEAELGLNKNDMFLTIGEFENWGYQGALH